MTTDILPKLPAFPFIYRQDGTLTGVKDRRYASICSCLYKFYGNRKFEKTNKVTVSTQDTRCADYYFGVLKNLDANSKLDLIAKLSQSLKTDETHATSLESLFGAYQSEETADEIIAKLRASRVSNRNIEPL